MMITDMIRRNLHSQSAYLDWLLRDLSDCDSILELGCGSCSPILKIGLGPKTDAVDIFQPYIDKHNKAHDYHECWQADILTMPFMSKRYDAVVMFDVLEHLQRDKVIRRDLFREMENCARKKVIFFTPNGFVENDEVDGDVYQRHVSAWMPQDYLRRGYTVKGATGLRCLLGKASIPKNLLCDYLSQFSQPFIYPLPNLAWHSYAVKRLMS